MSSGDASDHVPTKWAQRKDMLLITICVEDCKNADVKFEDNKIIFKGQGGALNTKFNAEMELFKEIVPEKCRWEQTARLIFIHAEKKESGPFWPRLLNSKIKQHWLKVDFDKMKDEDESSDDEVNGGDGDLGGVGSPNLDDMMAQMARGSGSGGYDLNDLDGDDNEPDSDDSDDEEVPDLEAAPGDESENKSEKETTEEPTQVKA